MKSKRHNGTLLFFLAIFLVLLQGCTATKYLPEGETFYDGAEIKFLPQGEVRGLTRVEEDLQELITPKPNQKFLGARLGPWFYYRAGESTKKKGLKYNIKKKFGREPVLLKNATPQRTAEMLQAELQNEGYFKSTVKSEVSTNEKKKTSKVIYTVTIYPPFRLRNIEQHYSIAPGIRRSYRQWTTSRCFAKNNDTGWSD